MFSAVKNQCERGSCWAFCATQAVESKLALTSCGYRMNLSAQLQRFRDRSDENRMCCSLVHICCQNRFTVSTSLCSFAPCVCALMLGSLHHTLLACRYFVPAWCRRDNVSVCFWSCSPVAVGGIPVQSVYLVGFLLTENGDRQGSDCSEQRFAAPTLQGAHGTRPHTLGRTLQSCTRVFVLVLASTRVKHVSCSMSVKMFLDKPRWKRVD